jgi:hypothetical protein
MGIERVIQKFCVQTAVYWGSPQEDGMGGFTFDDPVELAPPTNGVMWSEKAQLVVTAGGAEETSDAEILVCSDLDMDGYLYLGELADLSDEEKADPMLVNGARQIISKSKTPMVFSTTEFVRKVYLRRRYNI